MAAFYTLAELFAKGCQQEPDARFTDQRPHKRKASSKRKSLIISSQQKPLLILYYLKRYPTFDVRAATFGLPRSKAYEHAHRPAKALERTLHTQSRLPARAIESLAQMQQVFANVPVLLLGATERGSS